LKNGWHPFSYKPGWLYYRCRELGLEDTLQELRDEQVIP